MRARFAVVRSLVVAVALFIISDGTPSSGYDGSRLPTERSTSVRMSIALEGRDRRYLLHLPSGAAPKTAWPLILVFHGGSQTPEQMEEISGFSALSDAEGFVVAYPEGIDRHWSDGRGTTPPERMGIDDVAFVRRVVVAIQHQTPIDPHRIYAAGPSNGGIFAQRLGCEMADTFAAIGSVIAAMASNVKPHCHPTAAVSVVGIQSVTDPLIPFDGGEEGGTRHAGRGGRVEGGRATQELWAHLNHCTGGRQWPPCRPRCPMGRPYRYGPTVDATGGWR